MERQPFPWKNSRDQTTETFETAGLHHWQYSVIRSCHYITLTIDTNWFMPIYIVESAWWHPSSSDIPRKMCTYISNEEWMRKNKLSYTWRTVRIRRWVTRNQHKHIAGRDRYVLRCPSNRLLQQHTSTVADEDEACYPCLIPSTTHG